MLPKSQRLSTKQFNEVLEKGRVSHTVFFIVRSFDGGGDRRFAAVVPKKIGKTAVARHAGIRKIYDAIQANTENFPASAHTIVFAKKNIGATSHQELVADLKSLSSQRSNRSAK